MIAICATGAVGGETAKRAPFILMNGNWSEACKIFARSSKGRTHELRALRM